MSLLSPLRAKGEVIYPDSDGQPIAENTLQFEWITTIKGGLDALFRDDPNVFVAGDLLWYPVEGDNKIRLAPDAMVVFGRPKGYRGSYQQWREGGIAPQVVFEVLSPGNRFNEMLEKLRFYEKYGVDEYYMYDPEGVQLSGWRRGDSGLQGIDEVNGWTSPHLGIQFRLEETLQILGPDGRLFATYVELTRQRDEVVKERDEVVKERDEVVKERDEVAKERDEVAKERDAQRRRAEHMAERLRAMGVDPEG